MYLAKILLFIAECAQRVPQTIFKENYMWLTSTRTKAHNFFELDTWSQNVFFKPNHHDFRASKYVFGITKMGKIDFVTHLPIHMFSTFHFP